MSSNQYTYRIATILGGVLLWEIVFWILTGALLYIMGYFASGANDHVDFVAPGAFWLLLLLIPISVVYFYNLHRTNRIFEQSGQQVRMHMFQPVSSGKSFFRFFLFRNAFVFLILAMAQPAFGSKRVSGSVESLELVLCLDISNSMNTRDIDDELSRLSIAKRAITELINNLHGEKIGVCVFANSAFTQLPITIDYHAAKMYVNDIETSMISSQGTNVKEALETSISMFSENKKSTKGIILVTDGENHEAKPDDVLAEIKERQIQLVVLGLGTREGGLVPKNPDRPELGYKSTALGTSVLSKVNPQFIAELASKGGGYSTISDDPFPNLSGLLKQINRMKRTKLEAMEFDVKENRYQIPLALSLFFWLLFLVWSSSMISKVDKLVVK